MGGGLDQRYGADAQRGPRGAISPDLAPGKPTLVEQLEVQRSTGSKPTPTDAEASAVQHVAAQGIAGAGGPLPHAGTIVLLWESDSIEGSAEEHRKLEEYQRRRQQPPSPAPRAAAEPSPSTATTPTPVPPLGEGPQERRYPNQTCGNQVLDALQRAMHDVCDRIPGENCSPGKVNPKKLARRPCSQIRQRIQAFRECLRHRQNIQDQCFGGAPDPKHADVLSEFRRGLDACVALEAINCAPGHPMAEL